MNMICYIIILYFIVCQQFSNINYSKLIYNNFIKLYYNNQ